MMRRLREMGFRIPADPQGAFYIFADASDFTQDSLAFAFDVLEKAHVGITPGIDFGQQGQGYIRFSYANSIENIENLDKIVEEQISKLYTINQSKPGKYLLETTIQNKQIHILICIIKSKIYLQKQSINLGINYDVKETQKFCEKYNIYFNGLGLFAEYKDIDSITNFINCISKLAEIYNK